MDALVGGDFFTKEVWTLGGVVTRNPNEQWMKQIARNVTMAGAGFLDGMKYLILDRDGKYAPSCRELFKSSGIEVLRLPPRRPNLNAFAERFVRSIK